MRVGSPPGLLRIQNTILGVKTPRIEVFFIPLERSWSVDVQNDLAWAILDICSTSYGRKKSRESNWQFDSRPLKVGNRPDSGACRGSAIWCWKDLKESYKFGLDLAPIGGRGEKLWSSKVPRVQTGTVSRLHFGSLGKKCHSDAGAAERRREYYMGEGGGFPQVRAVVSQMNAGLPVACPNTKSVSGAI
jgi:hypothetical protein